MSLSETEIWQWSHDPSVAKRIASRLARDISNGHLAKWSDLPDNTKLASEHDTTLRTVGRAKRLLADRGVLKKSDGRYYVA